MLREYGMVIEYQCMGTGIEVRYWLISSYFTIIFSAVIGFNVTVLLENTVMLCLN